MKTIDQNGGEKNKVSLHSKAIRSRHGKTFFFFFLFFSPIFARQWIKASRVCLTEPRKETTTTAFGNTFSWPMAFPRPQMEVKVKAKFTDPDVPFFWRAPHGEPRIRSLFVNGRRSHSQIIKWRVAHASCKPSFVPISLRPRRNRQRRRRRGSWTVHLIGVRRRCRLNSDVRIPRRSLRKSRLVSGRSEWMSFLKAR